MIRKTLTILSVFGLVLSVTMCFLTVWLGATKITAIFCLLGLLSIMSLWLLAFRQRAAKELLQNLEVEQR